MDTTLISRSLKNFPRGWKQFSVSKVNIKSVMGYEALQDLQRNLDLLQLYAVLTQKVEKTFEPVIGFEEVVEEFIELQESGAKGKYWIAVNKEGVIEANLEEPQNALWKMAIPLDLELEPFNKERVIELLILSRMPVEVVEFAYEKRKEEVLKGEIQNAVLENLFRLAEENPKLEYLLKTWLHREGFLFDEKLGLMAELPSEELLKELPKAIVNEIQETLQQQRGLDYGMQR